MKLMPVVLLSLLTGLVSQVAAQVPVEKIAFEQRYAGSYVIFSQNADLSAEPLAVGEGIKPSWSPDGSKIAFESYGDVYVRNLTNVTVINLTNHPSNDGAPSWSTDGSHIAFQSDRDGALELYTMRTDGSEVRQLTHNVGFISDPAWSPDSTRIAYDCEIQSGNRDICTINVATGAVVQLTTDPAWDSGAAWSPDGSKIAFSTKRYESQYGGSIIAIMNADGSGVHELGVTSGGDQPAWSPDGSRIAFHLVDCWVDYELVCDDLISIANADNSQLVGFTYGSNPSWVLSAVTVNRPPVASIQYTCSGLMCTFDGSGSFDTDGTITNYEWTISDGTTASGAMLHHTFPSVNRQLVTLTVTDNTGLISSDSVIAPNVPPIATFTFSCIGIYCTFDGSGSSDSDGTITNYSWTFGDGTSASSYPAVSHTFSVPGNYLVTLTVSDDSLARAIQSRNVTATLPTMHVGDLDGAGIVQASMWTASVTITAHDWSHNRLANVTVSGSWSTGGASSCTTNALGQCVVSKSISRSAKSLRFTVANIVGAPRTYDVTMNHDPDGDSTGTSIIVGRP